MKKMVIGQIVKPQGIKGEIKVKPFVEDLDKLESFTEVFIGEDNIKNKIETVVVRQGFAYFVIQGINDRTKAENLRNKFLYILESDARNELDEEEYFIEELIGFEVTDENKKRIGVLEDIENFGGLDVYTVKCKTGYLRFPNAPDVILNFDMENKQVILSSKKISEVGIYEN